MKLLPLEPAVPLLDLVRSCKMNNVTFVEIETLSGIQTHAIIDRGNGEFTSMLKSVYDEMIAAQENTPPIL